MIENPNYYKDCSSLFFARQLVAENVRKDPERWIVRIDTGGTKIKEKLEHKEFPIERYEKAVYVKDAQIHTPDYEWHGAREIRLTDNKDEAIHLSLYEAGLVIAGLEDKENLT